MTSRTIQTEEQRKTAMDLIQARPLPFTIQLTKGVHRSTEQNRLQRMWLNEAAEQLGDRTPEDLRAYCKLEMGVPILRAENELFCAEYDRLIRPMSYEDKLSIMALPLDFPVTRLMTTNQKWRYLDHMERTFTGQGVVLTIPKERQAA